MTPLSRYALPGAERGTGTISAGQRWYGWGHKFTVNAETARTNRGVDAPTVGNPEPFCTSTPPKPLSPKEVVGVAIVPTPIIACLRFPRIAVSAVTA